MHHRAQKRLRYFNYAAIDSTISGETIQRQGIVVTSRRNCYWAGARTVSRATQGRPHHRGQDLRILILAFSALSLWLLAGTVHSSPEAQSVGNSQRAPQPQGQNPNGMRIYLWGGLKSHGAGQHDYPQFLADWSKVLTEHGAIVDGALHPPTTSDLEHTDVILIYKGDAAFLSDTDKTTLEAFVKRGGGLVSFHDSLCGPDPTYFAQFVGGAKKHGEVNYTLDAPVHYKIVDKSDPIMKDMSDITLFDEAFFNMTWVKNPGVHVLATAEIAPTPSAGDHKGEIVPQIWTYEHTLPGGESARAFVWMQGHTYANFADYQIRRTLLRGIAWAAKKPVDELVNYVAPPRPVGRGMVPTGKAQ
jgi:type 1 glutamine amidotransferase